MCISVTAGLSSSRSWYMRRLIARAAGKGFPSTTDTLDSSITVKINQDVMRIFFVTKKNCVIPFPIFSHEHSTFLTTSWYQ